LDPLFLETYNFDWLVNLPEEKNIVLILDDSHGYGIIGKDGGGITTYVNKLPNITLIVTASLGKACGVPGGLILSNRSVIESIKSSSKIYAGGSPVAPAYLYALMRSKDIYKEALEKLKKNILLFKLLTKGIDIFKSQPDMPVFYTSANELYAFLKQNEMIISSFPYPTKDSPNITRIVLNSLHQEEDIEILGSLLKQWARK
jgi:7-keto-8-aminopelargonate synthetase-like enzyme